MGVILTPATTDIIYNKHQYENYTYALKNNGNAKNKHKNSTFKLPCLF